MNLKRFIVVVVICVMLGLLVVWQRTLSVRYGYRLNKISTRRKVIEQENARLYCRVQSHIRPGVLMTKIDRQGQPLKKSTWDINIARIDN